MPLHDELNALSESTSARALIGASLLAASPASRRATRTSCSPRRRRTSCCRRTSPARRRCRARLRGRDRRLPGRLRRRLRHMPLLDNNEGLAQMSGLLADELLDAETFNTRIEVDRRATKTINSTTLQTFQDMQRARATADLVAARFRQFDPNNPQRRRSAGARRVHLRAVRRGLLQRRPDEQGERRRHVQLRRAADRARSCSPRRSPSSIRRSPWRRRRERTAATALNLARIGKGRALLDLNQPAQAAAAVATVPSTSTTASSTARTRGGRTTPSSPSTISRPGSPSATTRARTAFPFVSLNDPRVPIVRRRDVFGASMVRIRRQHAAFPHDEVPRPQVAHAARDGRRGAADRGRGRAERRRPQHVPGEAERGARQRADVSGRSGHDDAGPAEARSAHGGRRSGVAAGRVDLLFRERAFNLFLTGHRVGDLRRLMYQYGRAPETVLPTGPYQDGIRTSRARTTATTSTCRSRRRSRTTRSSRVGVCTNRSADIK